MFEGDGATALALLKAHPRRVLKRMHPALKAEFDALIGGPDAYELDLADQL